MNCLLLIHAADEDFVIKRVDLRPK